MYGTDKRTENAIIPIPSDQKPDKWPQNPAVRTTDLTVLCRSISPMSGTNATVSLSALPPFAVPPNEKPVRPTIHLRLMATSQNEKSGLMVDWLEL
ncbi:hypothetical protein CDAR_217401 [Caerostris darwini]|uniref:Uncharacterized protein n=1 Tax=Caerostris darwini TaxID=1538125 RepID=A0AAV4SEK0_9ARAC|nr:hypothetical protein CDAR_217401 [Caerostris darwini]